MTLCETKVCVTANTRNHMGWSSPLPFTTVSFCTFVSPSGLQPEFTSCQFLAGQDSFYKPDLNNDCSLVQSVFCGVFPLGWCQSWSEFLHNSLIQGWAIVSNLLFGFLFDFLWNNTWSFSASVHAAWSGRKELGFPNMHVSNNFWYNFFVAFIWGF